MKKKTITSIDRFKAVKAANGDVEIEGWANVATSVDRGKEVVLATAWKNLDNYKKVPMMLFNHDPDKPIGKMLEVRPTERGLWVKGKISKSKDPFVSYVRDLVEEGILNAFSVGFDTLNEQMGKGGVTEITDLDLFEVSIVTLPMNQDSVFSLSAKSLKGLGYKEMKSKILRQKGAFVAAALQNRIEDLIAEGGFDKDKVAQMVIEKAGISPEDFAAIISGELTPVPEAALAAFSEILGLSLEELQGLDKNDAQEGEAPPPEEAKKAEGEPEPTPAPEEPKTAKSAPVGVIAVKIRKDAIESLDAAKAWAEKNGWENSSSHEDDEHYSFTQKGGELYEGETEMELEDGAVVMLGKMKPPEEESPPEEDKPEETKALDPEDPECKKAAIPAASDGMPAVDESPAYEQARQTNVLLGQLVQEIQAMSAKLDKIVTTPPAAEEETVEPEMDEMSKKMLSDGLNRLAKIKERLRQYDE